MAFKKTKDLAVAVGKYTQDGKEKNRYQNVGYILEDESGAKMIMINRSFNPAGVPFKDGSEAIIISQFDVKEKTAQAPAQQQPAPAAAGSFDPFDDDIPF